MKKAIVSGMLILALFSCSEKKPVADPQVLIEADIAFSEYSIQHGYQQAFIEFADDSVVLLKPNRMPIVGKQSLIKSYEGRSDSGLVLVWKPVKAVIATSGDLGFTYGFWTLKSPKDSSQGTYLSVWKKDISGKWKYMADTGNDGIGK